MGRIGGGRDIGFVGGVGGNTSNVGRGVGEIAVVDISDPSSDIVDGFGDASHIGGDAGGGFNV